MSLLSNLIRALVDIDGRLRSIEEKEDTIMTAIEDLQAIDTELASAVTDLSASVDRIDTDFASLEQVIADGGNAVAIEAEIARIRASIDAAKTAKAAIDTTDPAPIA